MKKCNKCGEIKPLSEFYFRKDRQLYKSNCIDCDHKRKRKIRERNKQKNLNKDLKIFPIVKKCAVCGEIKQASEFIKDAGRKDGLYYRCKECNREYYNNNRDHLLDLDKKYRLKRNANKPQKTKPTEEELKSRELKYRKITKERNIKKWKDITYNQCKEVADKCNTRRDYYRISSTLYNAARINGWLDEFFPLYKHHMPRYLYSFVFSDNCAYVGLTASPDKRYNDHTTSKKSAVYLHIEQTGLTPEWNIYPNGPHDQYEAAKLEKKLIDKFKKKGYRLLNRIAGGGLGGFYRQYTLEESITIAKKSRSRNALPNSVYSLLKEKNMLDELLPANIDFFPKHPKGYWTYEMCKEECKKYKSRKQLSKCNISVYKKIKEKGWINELMPLLS